MAGTKNRHHLQCSLFTSAPHFCQMRQGSYPGCCSPPRVVLSTQEAEQSGSLDLVHGFGQRDAGPFIEKSHYTAMEEGEWNARGTNSFAARPWKAWPLCKCKDLSTCCSCISCISSIYKSISIYPVYTALIYLTWSGWCMGGITVQPVWVWKSF